ncbi:MAG: hypothetical protein KDB26_08405 [Microthrixaceae bacterium]|nr:hypothetical protein [Microthrixaceae bacterium]
MSTETTTEAYTARKYLSGLTSAFSDGTHPSIDRDLLRADEHPEGFARLVSGWNNCIHAASTINSRYYEDWNRARGALTVIAPRVREASLSELRIVWMTLCRNYIQATLDRDRIAWDCVRCGEHVSLEETIDFDRCPYCEVLLTTDDSRTDWLL